MIARFYIGLVSISCAATISAMDYEAIHNLKRSGTMLAPVLTQRNWGAPHTYAHSAPTPSFVPTKKSSSRTPSPTAASKSKSLGTEQLESASKILQAQAEAKEKQEAEAFKRLLEAEKAKARTALLQTAAQAKLVLKYSVGETTFETAFSLTPLNQENPEQKS